MGVPPQVGLYSLHGTPDDSGARDNDPVFGPTTQALGGLPEVQENKIRGAVKKSRFGATAGTIRLEIPIHERLMGLPYEKLKAIIQDDAKMGAEQALHEAMHYHSGFECAGYTVPEG